MNTLKRNLFGLLMASTALMASGAAFAQAQSAPSQPQPADVTEPATESAPEEAGDEIVVLGRNIPEPIRDTAEVANFITVEDLERTGDDNAAQALTRVTGLSLVQGRFVYVRGLGERYSAALLNGSPLPSPEPLQRVVPLDLFPSGILAGVAVQKTFSANLPGEFGGGLIDLTTVGVPNKPYFQASIGGSYNTETNGRTNFTYRGGGADDAFGFDDGTRKLPVGVRAYASDRPVIGGTGNFTDAQLQDIARSFVTAPNYVMQRDRTPFNGSFDLSGGTTFDTGVGEVGFVGVLGYRNSWQARDGLQQLGGVDAGNLVVRNNARFQSNQNDVTWNGLLGFGWENGDHEIRWTNLWVRNTTKEARRSTGALFELGDIPYLQDNTEYFARQLLMSQLVGEHELGDLKIEWRGSIAETTRDAPYQTRFLYTASGAGGAYRLSLGNGSEVQFSDLIDTTYGGGVDFTWDAPIPFVRQADIRFGAAYSNNERESTNRVFQYRQGPNFETRYLDERIDFLLSDRNINDRIVTLLETGDPVGAGRAQRRYEGQLEVASIYGQIDSEIVPLIRASLGVRYEDGEQTLTTGAIFGQPAVATYTIAEEYVLPGATLTWNFAEDQQLRLGVSKTVARPQFRELAPQQYIDPETDRLFSGNPYLQDSEILNADLRYEYYFARNQYVTGGVFYKEIENPIEAIVFGSNPAQIEQSFANAPKAELYGIEAEIRKYWELNTGIGWLDAPRWFTQANYTYSKSELKVSPGDVIFPPSTIQLARPATDYFSDGDRMQGQSEHIANVQVGFENEDAGTQLTLLATYVGERVSARAPGGQPDLIQDPGVLIDLAFRQDFEFRGRELTFSFEARNLGGENSEEFQEAGGRRVDVNTFDLGTSFSLGLTARF